jgi:hypothetical protein
MDGPCMMDSISPWPKIEHCEMVTGDRRLFNAVSPHLDWVRWIGDYVVQDTEGSP